MVKDLMTDDAEAKMFMYGLEKIFAEIERHPDIQTLLNRFGHEYIPSDGEPSTLKWFAKLSFSF